MSTKEGQVEAEQGKEVAVEKRCVRCGIPTAGMCPRCRKYVCMKGICNDSHDSVCKEAK